MLWQARDAEVARGLLRKAYELLKNKRRWTKDASAKNAAGEQTSPQERDAVKWCASGAINKFGWEEPETNNRHYVSMAEELLIQGIRDAEHLGEEYVTIPGVNDGRDGYRRIMRGFHRALGLDGPEGGFAVIADETLNVPAAMKIEGTITVGEAVTIELEEVATKQGA